MTNNKFLMNVVKRAIVMAAGLGKRLCPITQHIPKPLIRVNGTRMIDTIIQSLHKNNIYEIYIVVGYLKEQFYELEKEYQGLKILENPYYDTCNNISSLYVARNFISDAIILDGDQVIYNPKILSREFERSSYNCVWVERNTKEWLLNEKDGIVASCSKSGGAKGWQLYSVSRWTADDGERLKHHLEIEFEQKKNYQIFWDDIALFCYPSEYKLGVYKMNKGDIIEIDTYKELVEIDSSYTI